MLILGCAYSCLVKATEVVVLTWYRGLKPGNRLMLMLPTRQTVQDINDMSVNCRDSSEFF